MHDFSSARPRPGDALSEVLADLRLTEGSSAHQGGVELTDPVLRDIDGDPPVGQRPDSGCYPFGSPPLTAIV